MGRNIYGGKNMSEDNNYNENLDNPGDYNSKSDFSKAEIVRQQVSRVNEVRSKEMREGYYNFDRLGNKVYVPDTRKEFISAIKALRTLLEPEVKRDETYQKEEEKILQEIKKAVETFGINEHNVQGNRIIIGTSKPKYIPSLGEVIPVMKNINKKGICVREEVDYVPGVYNRNHHNYWDFLVECYDKLNSQLSSLIDRAKYFKEEISY